MITNIRFRITTDQRGKISTGKKSEQGYPQSLDYFYIEDFPELMKVYGNKPQKLLIYFPSDIIQDFFDCNYVLYGGGSATKKGTKIRSCDSETCIHRIAEEIKGIKYGAGEETPCICNDLPEDDKKRCKYSMYFKAFIALPTTGKVDFPTCFMFESHSKNSGDAIFSELEKIKALNQGILRNVPFLLSVKMIEGKADPKQKFPIWSLQAFGTLSQIQENTSHLLAQSEFNIKQLSGKTEDPQIEVARFSGEIKTKAIAIIKTVKTKESLIPIQNKLRERLESGELTQPDFDEAMKEVNQRELELKPKG